MILWNEEIGRKGWVKLGKAAGKWIGNGNFGRVNIRMEGRGFWIEMSIGRIFKRSWEGWEI